MPRSPEITRRDFLKTMGALAAMTVGAQSLEVFAGDKEFSFGDDVYTATPGPVIIALNRPSFEGRRSPTLLVNSENSSPIYNRVIDPSEPRLIFLRGKKGRRSQYRLRLVSGDPDRRLLQEETISAGSQTVYQTQVKGEDGQPLIIEAPGFPSGYFTPIISLAIRNTRPNESSEPEMVVISFCDKDGFGGMSIPRLFMGQLRRDFGYPLFTDPQVQGKIDISFPGYISRPAAFGVNCGQQEVRWGEIMTEQNGITLRKPARGSEGPPGSGLLQNDYNILATHLAQLRASAIKEEALQESIPLHDLTFVNTEGVWRLMHEVLEL